MVASRTTYGVIGLTVAALLSVALLPLSIPARAQTGGPDLIAKLTALKLLSRGKPGDRVVFDTDLRNKADIDVGIPDLHLFQDIESQEQWVFKVRSANKRGGYSADVKRVKGTDTIRALGDSKDHSLPPIALVATLSANGQSLTTVGGKNSKQAVYMDAPTSFGFPDKELHAGDSWDGSVPVGVNRARLYFVMPYKGTLVGFEMYREMPCAHIEYSVDAVVPGNLDALKRLVPSGGSVRGNARFTGNVTAYYTLDRGIPMDQEYNISGDLNFESELPETPKRAAMHVTVTGSLSISGTITASKLPAFDAKLLPASLR